ncbi:MAG: hypothetical protein M1820_004083 [Bogoriella megaspora]|nr:MAG: hypothetical protein M1820_004083 [Bogoriella megaspora]
MNDLQRDLPIIFRDSHNVEAYEDARTGRLFNKRRPDRFPAAVVEASKVEHVVGAIQLARQRKWRVSVRSGGHSWACWSVRDDAILVDLGKLHRLDLDEEKSIASVSPSTTGRQLNAVLGTKGLMFGGGHCPDVGLGGFLLQGGMGMPSSKRRVSKEKSLNSLSRVW